MIRHGRVTGGGMGGGGVRSGKNDPSYSLDSSSVYVRF